MLAARKENWLTDPQAECPPLNIVFAGTPDVAIPTLEALVESSHNVVGVITRAPKRRGRKRVLQDSEVGAWAKERGLPVFEADRPDIESLGPWLDEVGAQLGVVVAYGAILDAAILDALPEGWVNLHFSALPDLRGAAPVQRAIMRGDETFGSSVFMLDEGMDTGPVLSVQTHEVAGKPTAGRALMELAELGATQMVKAVDQIACGEAVFVDQDEDAEASSYAPMLSRADGFVDFEQPAAAVDGQVRGCTPSPGAWTTLPDGTNMKLDVVVPTDLDWQPGALAFVDGKVVVGCAEGSVHLTNVAPAGKRMMDAASWWRGARLSEGDRLGVRPDVEGGR